MPRSSTCVSAAPVDVVLSDHAKVGWPEHIAGVCLRSGCSSRTRGIDNDRSAILARVFDLSAITTILTPRSTVAAKKRTDRNRLKHKSAGRSHHLIVQWGSVSAATQPPFAHTKAQTQ
jgi:hypothetical protein